MTGDEFFWNSGPLGNPGGSGSGTGGNWNGWGSNWMDMFHQKYPNAGTEPQHPATRPTASVWGAPQTHQVTPGVFPWGYQAATGTQGGPIPVSPPPVNGQPGGPQNPPGGFGNWGGGGSPPWLQHFQNYLGGIDSIASPPWLQNLKSYFGG